ncbi:O-acetylhomoserine aminocarboxypropyltransferase/cysteine synthase family protein [Gulosibacter faecalis]|uniref:O-acetylhomoserine aminocarboxypropyltransferase/cysteine synthase family protein n=1 Tax=Gulosibacter faecalis TaxID=272240 RepID=A0ABW5V3Y7_9MICO|nr:PLP-dependent transferase [Gulosibacter faecalis]
MSHGAPVEPNYDWEGFGFDTRQVHAGEQPNADHGDRVAPIHVSNAFRFDSFQDTWDRFAGETEGQLYSRHLNPTVEVAEQRIASLEGGTGAVAFASGSAAIMATILALCGQGEHFVSTASIYSGTIAGFERTLGRLGISVSFVADWRDADEWRAAIRPETRAIFTETIPNPKNDIVDIAVVAGIAESAELPLIVDNTIATPALIRPIEHGADIIVHSSTKFLGGHGATMSGVAVDGGRFDWAAHADRYPQLADAVTKWGARRAFEQHVRFTQLYDFGATLSPFNAFLLQQGMETLSLRMERHIENARDLALWLDAQPAVESVDYAGLPGSRDAELAERLYGGRSGSVFSMTVRGGLEGARTFIDHLRVFSRMTNIGDTRSLAIHPGTTTHVSFSEERRAALGIHPGLVRLSVGIESVDDLRADLASALSAVAAAH